MSDSTDAKLNELLELERMNARNIFTLYRRMAALAHMVEAVAEGKEPRLPKVLRAEIDASVNPDYFCEMADADPAEFARRYGEDVLAQLRDHGIDSITRIGDFPPLKMQKQAH